MNKFVFTVTALLLATSPSALPCSLRQMVPIKPELPEGDSVPDLSHQPSLLAYRIMRGTDLDPTSCSDLGEIEIYIKPSNGVVRDLSKAWFDSSLLDFGYRFEVIDSSFADDYYTPFDTEAIVPVEAQEEYYVFSFAWLDGSQRVQEPLNMTLRVYAVDKYLNSSEGCDIEIVHDGGRTTNEWIWGTSTLCKEG